MAPRIRAIIPANEVPRDNLATVLMGVTHAERRTAQLRARGPPTTSNFACERGVRPLEASAMLTQPKGNTRKTCTSDPAGPSTRRFH